MPDVTKLISRETVRRWVKDLDVDPVDGPESNRHYYDWHEITAAVCGSSD